MGLDSQAKFGRYFKPVDSVLEPQSKFVAIDEEPEWSKYSRVASAQQPQVKPRVDSQHDSWGGSSQFSKLNFIHLRGIGHRVRSLSSLLALIMLKDRAEDKPRLG
jgi:hypothetical protein